MNDLEPDQHHGIRNRRWVWFFLFLSVQSLPILFWIISLPGDPKNNLVFGLSMARLVLVLVTLLLGLFFLAAARVAGMKESRIQSVFQTRWREGNAFLWLEGLSVLVSVAAWAYLVYLHSGVDGGDSPLYIRFQPFLIWLIALGAQFAIWLWYQCYGWHAERLQRYYPMFVSSGVVAVVFLILGIMMSVTGWGLTPDIFLWGYPGVPILAWQVWFALSAGFLLLMALVTFPVIRAYQRRLDWIIGTGLFLLATVLWLMQPIPRSFFFPTPRAPAFAIFPYSDAGFYDYVAQTLLVGEGYLNGSIVTRPLYILFLAVLHGVQGQNYSELI
ncbi:MAG TPA: hypothetical protein VF338_11750, partial [Leptolinea sp.]